MYFDSFLNQYNEVMFALGLFELCLFSSNIYLILQAIKIQQDVTDMMESPQKKP